MKGHKPILSQNSQVTVVQEPHPDPDFQRKHLAFFDPKLFMKGPDLSEGMKGFSFYPGNEKLGFITPH